MKFSKYHGCGNSFVIMDEQELPGHLRASADTDTVYPQLAVKTCDVNTGVGADGMIIVRREPALEMVFYNRDGSRAPMCGNGIRCFAHFCREEGIRSENSYPVKTLAGDMIVNVTETEPFRVRINMGRPVLSPAAINVDDDRDDFLGRKLRLRDGSDVDIDSLFMGTVHTVVFTDELDMTRIPQIGREICEHPVFREKTNVNFVKAIDDETIEMRTYERGVGMTLACGTGACASVVVANMKGICGSRAEVKLELGSLYISIEEDGCVYMEGPSVKIMDGELCDM